MAGSPKGLKKELGLFDATVYGIGIILGAGIYAIIGEGAGLAGNAVWLAFIISAVIAAFTGLSYAELSSMFPKAAAEYNYTKEAFRKRSLSFIVGWTMLLACIISGTTVSIGFAGYFSALFGAPVALVAIALIAVFALMNFIGVKLTTKFNTVATFIEFSGLLIICIIGAWFMGNVNYFEMPQGMPGLMAATAIIFFAYIGFEDIVNMSEDTKNAAKTIPKALLISLLVSTILYILVSVSAVSVIGWQALSSSQAPLAAVASKALGPQMLWVLSAIALFATGNTALIMFIAASRILYGMAKAGSLPTMFSRLHNRRRTPWIAIALVAAVAIALASLGSLKVAVSLTNISIFIGYMMVNLSVIKLRFSKPHEKRQFRVPGSLGRLPLLPLLGVVSCFLMLFFFDIIIVAAEAAFLALGYSVHRLLRRRGIMDRFF